MSRKRLGEILIDANIINQQQLKHALAEQQRWGGQLGKILIDQGVVDEGLLVRALSKQLNIPIVALDSVSIPADVLATISVELSEQHGIIPFHRELSFLDVAMSDPMNLGILDELQIRTRLNVRPHLAGASQIRRAIRRSYRSDMEIDDIDVDFEDIPLAGSHSEDALVVRDAEITALQRRLSTLEALVKRDEDVIRKVLGLLVSKNVATREEILDAIK